MYKSIVLSGGSIKGYSYLGILRCLEERDMLKNIENIVGTSIGTLFGAIITMGISYEEIIYIINKKFILDDISFDNLMERNGFCEGVEIEEMICEIIKLKFSEDITLKELFDNTKKNFYISVTNLNKHCIEYLSHKNYPEMKLKDALRMAITLPFIFETRKYNGTMFVDGALMKNISYNDLDPKTTLSLLLTDKSSMKKTNNIDNIEDFIHNVMMCVKKKMDDVDYQYDNVKIICEDINILKLNLTYQQKISMIKVGYTTLTQYFKKKN